MGNDNATFPEFFVEAQEVVDALGRDLLSGEAAARDGDVEPDLVNTLFRNAHSLKGICAMFGLTTMAALAHAMEGVLDGMRLGRVQIDVDVFDVLFACVERFGQLLAHASRGDVQGQEHISGLVAHLRAVADGSAKAAPAAVGASADAFRHAAAQAAPQPPTPPPQSPVVAEAAPAGEASEQVLCLTRDTLRVLTEYEEHRLRENVRKKRHLALLSTVFDLASFDTDLAHIDQLLKGQAEIISKLPSAHSTNPEKIGFEIIVGSQASIQHLRQLMGTSALAVQGIDPAFLQDSPTPQAGSQAPAAPPPAAPSMAATAAEKTATAESVSLNADVFADMGAAFAGGAAAAAKSAAASKAAAAADAAEGADMAPDSASERPQTLTHIAQTVRVDIRRLDRLMNLVGELSVIRSAIEKVSESAKQEYGFRGLAVELHKESRAFDRRLAELQAGIMEVRMVPMASLFDRMVRISRAIARDLGRQVRVVVQGEHTELDKLIIEDLSDPLMHLIRNAIDHGIEPPDVRRAQGKLAEGTVRLFAATQGNHVVVEVSDDGAGIDVERTRKIGLDRGMIRADEAIDMPDREVFNLLFAPGFSTRSIVSEFSGRGVGLDVVKTNIAKLSGVIDVHSEVNVGTRFTVTLPMTLAIIPALIVQVANTQYAIPLNTVMETLDLHDEMVQTIERRQVISVRGSTVPLIDLVKAFNLKVKSRSTPGFGVLAGMGGQRIALIVDELIGQQDIVIKSLGRRLKNVFGVSGATELGNQQTILVLDVMDLMGYLAPVHGADTI